MTGLNTGLGGLVLAGGRATRIGGGDKPLRPIGGRPMLSQVLERLEAQVTAAAISANGDPARFAQYGLPVLADAGPGGQAGPLAGVLSGMAWATAETNCKTLLTVAGDTPFFPLDLASRLAEAVAERPGRIAVASSGGRGHPVFALWPTSLEGALRDFLASSANYSVAAFQELHGTVCVDFPMARISGNSIDPFFNVNTLSDLAQAEAVMGGGQP